MIDPLLAILFFTLFFLTHVVLFRLRLMQFQPLAFLFISLVWSGFLLAFAVKMNPIAGPLIWSSLTLYFLLCLAYVAETTTVENDSPSTRIVKCIRSRPMGRATYDELKSEVTDEEFIVSRLNDLVRHGHVYFEGGRYRLSARGKLIAGIVAAYRNLLGKKLGG